MHSLIKAIRGFLKTLSTYNTYHEIGNVNIMQDETMIYYNWEEFRSF